MKTPRAPGPREGEYVAFGGFPGDWRSVKSMDELEFNSWSSGATEISSVSENQFVCKFEREYWVAAIGDDDGIAFSKLGGLSGGPALVDRGLYWDLIGIISQYHEKYDAMFFPLLSAVNIDGTIESALV